jgi:hypothetical protein
MFDDENVQPIEEGDLKSFFGDYDNMGCAYIFLYQATDYVQKVSLPQSLDHLEDNSPMGSPDADKKKKRDSKVSEEGLKSIFLKK